jgi:hypothetical protein
VSAALDFTPDELDELVKLDPMLARQLAQAITAAPRGYMLGLFGKQLAFVRDPAPRKALLGSRRSGKTEALASWLLDGADGAPGELSLYVALSRNSARMVLWRKFQEIRRRFGTPLEFSQPDGQLVVTLPNKHQILMAGCSNASEIEKFRGLKLKRAAIDEGASFGSYLEALVEDVLDPTLMDLQGELAVCGTPGAVPAGYFYEITTGDSGRNAWPLHKWTVLENPYIPHAEEDLRRRRERNGWTDQTPTYRREWLAEWVLDRNALCYPYSRSRNGLPELPEGAWRYCLGVDLGFTDATAFVLVAVRSGDPGVYVLEAWKRSGMIPSAIAAQCLRYRERFKGKSLRLVIDEGGLGKGYAEELRQRYGIGCEPAEKVKKRAFQEIVRGEFLSGAIKVVVPGCTELIDEISVLTWDETGTEEDSRFENHAADAMLYAVRALRPGYVRDEAPADEVGSPEWWKTQDAAVKKRLIDRVKQKVGGGKGRLRRSDISRRAREL